MAKVDSSVRTAFYAENEEVICDLVRRGRILASAMGGIGSSRDPDRIRQDAAAAQTLAEGLVDELRELTGCEI